MSRARKPTATRENVKQILGKPTRKLTERERAERVSFYEETGHNPQPVEPGGNVRGRYGPRG